MITVPCNVRTLYKVNGLLCQTKQFILAQMMSNERATIYISEIKLS
jgi:hypothetical protein